MLFNAICNLPAWVVEDTGRTCFFEGMRQADTLFYCNRRHLYGACVFLRRWLRQRCGLEACAYRPSLAMLRAMYRWTKDCETGVDDLRHALRHCMKTVLLRARHEINAYRNCPVNNA